MHRRRPVNSPPAGRGLRTKCSGPGLLCPVLAGHSPRWWQGRRSAAAPPLGRCTLRRRSLRYQPAAWASERVPAGQRLCGREPGYAICSLRLASQSRPRSHSSSFPSQTPQESLVGSPNPSKPQRPLSFLDRQNSGENGQVMRLTGSGRGRAELDSVWASS